MVNLRCLAQGHDWRLAEPWTNAGSVMFPSQKPVWGMAHFLDGTETTGRDIRVQCADCGARAMAEFRRRDDWTKGIDTGWYLHVHHWRGGIVADVPSSEEVEAARRGDRVA